MGSLGNLVNGKEVIEKFDGDKGKWSDFKPKFALRDCPVCGATQADKNVLIGYANSGWVVYCMKCHNKTQFYKKESDAAGEWDERT